MSERWSDTGVTVGFEIVMRLGAIIGVLVVASVMMRGCP